MTDLEKRVNEVKEWLESDTTLIGTRWDNWEISKIEPTPRETEFARLIFDLQAEINRLKSGQVRLRPMWEAPRDGRAILVKHGDRYMGVDYSQKVDGWNVRSEYTTWLTHQFDGWIDLSDLPTEIEVE